MDTEKMDRYQCYLAQITMVVIGIMFALQYSNFVLGLCVFYGGTILADIRYELASIRRQKHEHIP